MKIKQVLDWLMGEAAAGWVLCIASVVLWIGSAIRRRRPQTVQFVERAKTALLQVDPSIQDRLAVEFDAEKVDKLSLLAAEIYNSGNEVITGITLRVDFSESSRVLVANVAGGTGDGDYEVSFEDRRATITIPYLNPKVPYNHSCTATFIVDGDPSPLVQGGGPGWSVKHVDSGAETTDGILRSVSDRRWTAFLIVNMLAVLAVCSIVDNWPDAIAIGLLITGATFAQALIEGRRVS